MKISYQGTDLFVIQLVAECRHLALFAVANPAGDLFIRPIQIVKIRPFVAMRVSAVARRTIFQKNSASGDCWSGRTRRLCVADAGAVLSAGIQHQRRRRKYRECSFHHSRESGERRVHHRQRTFSLGVIDIGDAKVIAQLSCLDLHRAGFRRLTGFRLRERG